MINSSCEVHGEGMVMSDMSGCEIERLHPLTDTPTWYTFVLCVALLIFLIAGIGGNASLFGLIVYVRKWVDRAQPEQSASPAAESTYCSIMLLCLVNLGISVSVAPLIVDNMIGLWLLGEGACKFHRTVAAGGNIMANFLIVGIAYDRFDAISVSLSKATSRRRPCSIAWRLIGFSLITVVLTVPTLMYSEIEVVTLSRTIEEPGTLTLVQIEKCSEMLPKGIFYWSVYSNAFVGFVLPMTTTVCYDLRVVRALYLPTRKIEQNQQMAAERRVAFWTTTIGLFHFVCCLPHWLFALYANVIFSGRHTDAAPSQAILQFFGAFRFVSSALSWIPAGLLNEHLELLDTCDTRQRPNLDLNFEPDEIQQFHRPTTVLLYRQHSQMLAHQTLRSTVSSSTTASIVETFA